MANDKNLKIIINAQLLPNSGAGGVETVLIGLISSLGQLTDGAEEYIIVCHWENTNWLKPYLGPNQSVVNIPQPQLTTSSLEVLKRGFGPLRPMARYLKNQLFPQSPPRQWPEVPISNGFFESLGCDVVHFPYQEFVLCALPSIYNPHDLQHLHYPKFFSPGSLAWRETIYPAACHFSHTIVTGSQWIKEDIAQHYRLAREKIQVIPWAPPTQSYATPSSDKLSAVQAKYNLCYPFAFYPAMLWEHKNHLRLLDALAQVRDREELIIRLVCTGKQHPDFWKRVEEKVWSLNLQEQVQFLGMVSPDELRAIYRLAQFVIVPTLFEAASGPVFEAWEDEVAVACSAVTSLPEQAGNAALLFNPYSTDKIADAIYQMATNEELRKVLIHRGKQRLTDFSWERTAKAYRAVYRRAANRTLDEEDLFLLEWDWMRSPEAGMEATI